MLESIWVWIAVSFVAGAASSIPVSYWKSRILKEKVKQEQEKKKRLRAAVVRKILLNRARRRKEKLSEPAKQSQPDSIDDRLS